MPTDLPPGMDKNDPQQVVSSAWADQALWSQVANGLGDSIKLWRARSAVAGVAGLFLSLLAGTMPGGTLSQKAVGTLGVLLLAVVPFLQQRLLSADRVMAWTRARSVAEQLKEAIYRHLMGALPPVPLDDGSPPPDPTGPGNLVRRCRAVKQDAADLALLAATTTPDLRPRKTAMTLDDYLADRLEGQAAWYRKSALASGQSARQLQQLEFMLGLAAVLLGALAGNLLPASATPAGLQSSPLGPWLALIATTGAAITSHIASSRNLETAARYFATHDLLKTLRDEWLVDPGRDAPARVLRLVDDVERALSVEHGTWRSGWAQAAGQTRSAAAAPETSPLPRTAAAAVAGAAMAGAAADATAEAPADAPAGAPADAPAAAAEPQPDAPPAEPGEPAGPSVPEPADPADASGEPPAPPLADGDTPAAPDTAAAGTSAPRPAAG